MVGGEYGDVGSKRPWEGRRENPEAKRSRLSGMQGGRGRLELRYLIPSSAAGAIIGKRGSKISELRDKYNASIQIPDSRGEERIVNTSASSIDDLGALCGEIAAAVHSENRHAETQEVRLLVHQSQAGGIIGTKGTKIKELRETTGAMIKVFQDCCPFSTERIVQIRGDNSVIVHCTKCILDFLETAPPKGPIQLFDPSVLAMEQGSMNNYGGYLEGGFGGNRMNAGNFDSQGSRMAGTFNRGGRQRGIMPRNNFVGRSRGNGRRNGNSHGNFGRDSRIQNRGHANFRQNASHNSPTTTKVTIPTLLAGCIIGRGGQRINGIRQESGAQITIAEPEHGAEDRVITIVGTEEQIQNAQFLLQRSVKMNSGKY